MSAARTEFWRAWTSAVALVSAGGCIVSAAFDAPARFAILAAFSAVCVFSWGVFLGLHLGGRRG